MIIAGIAAMITATVISRIPSPEGRVMDHTNTDSLKAGELVSVYVDSESLMEMPDGLYYAELYDEDLGYEYSFIIRDYSTDTGFLDETVDDFYNQKVTGRLYLISPEEEEAAVSVVCPYYDYFRDKIPDLYLPTEETIRENLTYGIRVTPQTNTFVINATGILLIAAGVLVLLCMILRIFLTRPKTALVMTGLMLALILTVILINLPAILTVMSVRKEGDGIFSIDYKADYKLDDYIEADITGIDGMVDWGIENLLHGVPAKANSKAYRCSSFAVVSPDGSHLCGRNMDYPETDTLVVHTAPKDGYESIALADLSAMGIGTGAEMDINDPKARVILLAAPYIIGDGVNEKGLAVTSLTIDDDPGTVDTPKHNLLLNVAVRVLLDRCADTDEAVEMLGNFDIYSPLDHGAHLFITDRNGNSVVVEWLDGNMYVVRADKVTNFPLYEPDYSLDHDGRYATLVSAMEDGKTFTGEEAMQLLDDVSQPDWTRWSAVYDLDGFAVDVCVNEEYDRVYCFSREYFDH